MARNYRGYAYFDNNPNIVKIFDDLEALLDFCRWELLPTTKLIFIIKKAMSGRDSYKLTETTIKVGITITIVNKEIVNDCVYCGP